MLTHYDHEQDNASMVLIKNLLHKLNGLTDKCSIVIDRENDKSRILADLTKYSHQLTSECRLVYGRNNHEEDTQAAKERLQNLGYAFERSGQAVHITMPLLLPKRNCGIFPELDTLRELLSLYFDEIPRYRDCTIIFQHVYSDTRNPRDIRDHDNLESRSVLNAIERFLLTSDSGYYCTNIHMTRFGKKDCTIITLLPGKLDTDAVRKAVTL